ncbi:coproporphyrinogen dehydrogenase HemZ [Oscillospiraceae bacterium LTW-04]|nr:coproporphyrinogen dehydrogenase HemZ [Oscillospiraceae bacterium MB24-C1]
MILMTRGFSHTYEIEMLSRMLFPALLLKPVESLPDLGAVQDYLLAEMTLNDDGYLLQVTLRRNKNLYTGQETLKTDISEKERVVALARILYGTALKSGCRELRWGILTGIRPVKLFHALAEQGLTEQQANTQLCARYLLSAEMAQLAQTVRRSEKSINDRSLSMGFSLYISIPFCPQRCSYCSFVSQSVEKMRHLVAPYVEQLCVEIAEIGGIVKTLGLTLQTIYFGGGTPTTLSAEQLTKIFLQIAHAFDLSNLLEYTVEAGRPDTIDRERLLALKAAGVTRLSVNPQTMNDDVLLAVGRKHTAQQVVDAFELAREIGFESINMDLIAGLPGDTPESFEKSLKKVLTLNPDNITVHTLTLKRASTLAEDSQEVARQYSRHGEVAQMVDTARRLICQAGYTPYYLYRQKNAVGSLDNTGYAKPGKEGLYNVFIMDETHTILAAGAGAVTKLRAPHGADIERIYNFKYPAEYLSRYQVISNRKERVKQFYENH